jgi:tetratricopeptide (TPR) repeat protein
VKKFIHSAFCIALSIVLTACANKNSHDESMIEPESVIIPINKTLFSNNKATVILQSDIFTLSPSQQKLILLAVNKKQDQGLKLHKAVEAVLSTKLSNFTYYGETYSAEMTMRLNAGNCMSLAVLTTAYAKLLGLEFSYREVNTLPIFEKENDLILSSSHVQAVLYDADFVEDASTIYLQKPSVVIDYFPSKNNRVGKRFNELTFLSMYYRNLAADALVENKLAKAFILAKESHRYNKQNIETINLLAVIHRRAGDTIGAEKIYQAGLQIQQSSLALISNYIMLLRDQKRFDEAEKYQVKLDNLDDPNPYRWLEQAYIAEQIDKKNKAIKYYEKALENAPYLNEAYLGLYNIYLERGHFAKAKAMLKQALEWTYEKDERKQYNNKLYSLAQL